MRSVVRRGRLRELGVDAPTLARHLRRGTIQRVGYDRFVIDRAEPSAAELLCAPGSEFALSHASAALAWGLPVTSDGTHVTVPNGALRRWVPPGVVVHQTRRWHAEVRDELVVTPLARTLADVACTVPLPDAVAVLDAGLRLGADPGDVVDHLGHGVPGAARARRALALADPRAESVLESRLRLVLVGDGLAPDDLQAELFDGAGRGARVDFFYAVGLVLESDGFEFHSSRASFRRDRARMQPFAGLGLLYLPVTWEDVTFEPAYVTSRVREALDARSAHACTRGCGVAG